jgi:hypothetical protein
MKITKWILTFILFVSTFFVINVAQYMTLSIITLPGGSQAVERVKIFPDFTQNSITYSDAFRFWADDMRWSLVEEGGDPEYTIRAWLDFDFWINGTRVLDYGLHQAKAIVIPAVAPIYEIKELFVYYNQTISDFKIIPEAGVPLTLEERRVNNAIDLFLDTGMDGVEELGTQQDYRFIHNLNLKLAKYNRVNEAGEKVYRTYVEKFINYRGNLDGEYEFISVSGTATFLFYQLFLAVILSMYFVYQNPIVLRRNEYNENEIEGRFLPRLPQISLGNRGKNKNRPQPPVDANNNRK